MITPTISIFVQPKSIIMELRLTNQLMRNLF